MAVGVNVTEKLQAPLAGTLPMQALAERAKGPLTVMPLTFKSAPALLVRVTVCAALVLPTAWPANVRFAADRVRLVAVPVKATVCGLSVALSVMVSVPG